MFAVKEKYDAIFLMRLTFNSLPNILTGLLELWFTLLIYVGSRACHLMSEAGSKFMKTGAYRLMTPKRALLLWGLKGGCVTARSWTAYLLSTTCAKARLLPEKKRLLFVSAFSGATDKVALKRPPFLTRPIGPCGRRKVRFKMKKRELRKIVAHENGCEKIFPSQGNASFSKNR